MSEGQKKYPQRKPYNQSNMMGLQEFGKIPPQAVELEEAVLGACLLESECVELVSQILFDDCFYKESHKVVYNAIIKLYLDNKGVDLLTVTEQLKADGKLDSVGGAYYIAQLTNRVASSANVEFHARILQQKYIKRLLIQASSAIIAEAYDDTTDVFDIVDHFGTTLDKVDGIINSGKTLDINIKKLADNAVQRYYERKALSNDNQLSGCTTGLRKANAITTGWQKKNLIILAARPAMGKTAYLVNNSIEAVEQGYIPIIFSLEMGAEMLMDRAIQCKAKTLNSDNFRFGKLDALEEDIMKEAANVIGKYPIYIDDTPSLKPMQVLSRTRKIIRDVKASYKEKQIQEEPKFIVFVDYLQIMEADNHTGMREQDVSSIARGLKTIAKKLDIPVVALCQLSRAVETRGGDKRPVLSDLRESGSIEQEADVVGFLYRPAYYGITIDEAGNSLYGIGELILAKNRHGKITSGSHPIQFTHNESITYIKDAYEDILDLTGSPLQKTTPSTPSYNVSAGLSPSTDFIFKSNPNLDIEEDSPF